MKTTRFGWPRRLRRSLSRLLGLGRKGRQAVTPDTWKIDEIKDIDNVVETFNSLVAQLCRDGSQLGELYVKAEQKAAKYALLSETVIDSVTSGILVVESTGEITLANSSARNILGFDAREEITGSRLSSILEDSTELEALTRESFKTLANVSRRILTVRTRTGRQACLGASTSCVASSPSKVDLVIVVFTELDAESRSAKARPVAETGDQGSRGYLRGVLDCYDQFSAVVKQVERVRARSESGALGTSDVADCARAARRAWEVMTAFALSLVARESLPELANLDGVAGSVLCRRKEFATVRLAPASGAPLQVKTGPKVLEAGLELLLLGCIADASDGVTMRVGRMHDDEGGTLEIRIDEHAARSQISSVVGDSLRDFGLDGDLRREAGLMLLRSLPRENHGVQVAQAEGTLSFSIRFLAPVNNGAGPAPPRSNLAESGPDKI